MNLNHPHLHPADGPGESDPLAAAVLNALARPLYEKLSWSLFQTLFLGLLSFGVLPILVWTKRLRQYITAEQQQLWHLAEWLRLHSRHPEAAQLRVDADAMRSHSDLRLLVFLSVGLMGILFFTQLHDYRFHWLDALLNCTYLYPGHRLHVITFGRFAPNTLLTFRLFNTWTLALGVAYVCHWLQVRTHAMALRKFVRRFNRIASGEGLAPLRERTPGIGLRPLWMVAAGIMAACGIVWGVPMMLAGAAHRRMIRHVSNATRAGMAQHLRAMLMARHPTLRVPVPVYLRRMCANEQCEAPVPEGAVYCPHCGMKVGNKAQRV